MENQMMSFISQEKIYLFTKTWKIKKIVEVRKFDKFVRITAKQNYLSKWTNQFKFNIPCMTKANSNFQITDNTYNFKNDQNNQKNHAHTNLP